MYSPQLATQIYASQHLYLDWCNNFLSIERFASYYGIAPQHAKKAINKGRVIHNDAFGHH